MTLTDEENIRQRLLEIKKSRLRKNQQKLADNLVQRFANDADVTLFENQQSPARQEEERILMQKYAKVPSIVLLQKEKSSFFSYAILASVWLWSLPKNLINSNPRRSEETPQAKIRKSIARFIERRLLKKNISADKRSNAQGYLTGGNFEALFSYE